MFRPHELLFAAMILGAIGGYSAAKTGLDEKLINALEQASDRRALRNAQIMLGEAERRSTALPVKVTDGTQG